MSGYKYAGEAIWKETAWGPEQVAVGSEGDQGGKGSRLRRRERRAAAMYPFGMAPFTPFGMPPGFPPGFPPAFPGLPPMPDLTAVPPVPTPVPAQTKAPSAAAAAAPTEVVWGKRQWKDSDAGGKKEWPAKKPKWNESWEAKNEESIKGWEENSMREKTARFLGIVLELQKVGKSAKDSMLYWCLKCRLKAYAGNDMCSTPGCKWPTSMLSMLPADGPTHLALAKA